ncbi:MAG TPA: phage tail protein [Candidatus Angelobacter sp.]|nr:phage tail protein [Candidatus Angelobacter sp.]
MAGRIDPFKTFNFRVEIEGVARADFSEVSGLGLEVAAIEYREGNDKLLTVRKLPGLVKYNNITLKRGITIDRSLWDWVKQTVQGNVRRANMLIVLLDDQGQDLMRWKVREAWPCKYEGPTLNAKGNEVAIESLEVCHEGFELVE